MSKEGVTVGVRVRPLLPEEGHEEECVRIETGRVAVTGSHRLRQFPFQYLLDRNAPQQQVFQLFALPLLEDLFKGHNVCLVAYGQNRSGKSFTVCGGQSEETKGVIPRIVDHLTCKLYSQETKRRLVLRVSYVQIWQEEVIDLLSIRRGVNVQVVEGNEQTTLRNVQMKTIIRLEDIETHFILGNRKRQLAYSKKYRSSEQSTSVFTLYLESLEDGKVRRGKFDIVEMQANEVVNRFEPILPNGTQSKQYDLSAHCFKNVVNSLIYGGPSSHVPYGDSKVTQILRSALGGNARAKILFHISPTVKCHDATIATLRTAAACQLIENTPSTAFDSQNSLIRQLIQQEEDLGKQAQAVEEELYAFDEKGADENDDIEDGENEFLSKSVLLQKKREQREEKKQRCLQLRQSLKKQLQTLQSLFLTLQPLKNKHQVAFFKENYMSALERLAKNNQIAPPPASLYESAENWSISQTSFRKLNQRERFYKQEVYDLQRQFQQERELMLTTLREVTQRYKFFEKVAQRAVRPEEMELLKMNSKYDPTKRVYQVPLFAIRDKRVSHASRFFSPQQAALINSRAISERKFMMTQLGSSQHKPENKITQVKQIVSQENIQDNPYFHKVPRIKQSQSPKQQAIHRMSQDQYELVRSSVMSNRLKRKTARPDPRSPSNSSRSVKVKPILSPRFRFK